MPMVEKPKGHKKVFFSEEDAATLLQRYDGSTVLTLLREVALYPQWKIDWNELVAKTSTGISSAREYQMLWRHLAYRSALPEKFEDGTQPLDDDSDLECELEASPPISSDVTSEAAACVKVMIHSGTLSESTPSSSTIEAPLAITVPLFCSTRSPNEISQTSYSMQGSSIIFPVTVHRQTLPSIPSTEGIEANRSASGNVANKRKRNPKPWSEQEDVQLRAAVQKFGEGNWTAMLKSDGFPNKRSAVQLAQRWDVLQKKVGSMNPGTNSTSSQYTAEQLATRRSLSLALDMPFKKLTAAGSADPARAPLTTGVKNPVQHSNNAEASTVPSNSVLAQHPSQPVLSGSHGTTSKSKVAPEKIAPKCNVNPDSALRATAVAAGARIVSVSDTVSLRNAAQGRVASHVMPTVSSSMKPSIPAGSPALIKAHSNVPDVTPKPVPSSSSAVTVLPAPASTHTVKATSPTVDNYHPTALSNTSSEQNNDVSSVTNIVSVKEEVNPTEDLKVSDPSLVPKERVQKDGSSIMKKTPSEEFLDDKAGSQNSVQYENHGNVVKNSNEVSNIESTENHQRAVGNSLDKEIQDSTHKTMDLPVNHEGKLPSADNGSSKGQSSIAQDESSESLELPS